MSAQSDTPRCDALHRNPLDSNDLRAWRNLARDLEHQISLAQTEIKGHMRIEDELKAEIARHSRILFAPLGDNHHNAWACPYCNPHIEEQRLKLTQAQSRIAELEKVLREIAGSGIVEHWRQRIDAVLKDRA